MEDSESQFIGRLAIILFCLFPILSQANSFSAQEADMLTDRIISFADDEVKERLESLGEDVVEHRFDPSVKYIIRRYVMRWRTSSEKILGRAAIYFPIFEKHLAEANLPDALKYLTITESALRSRAVSRVGAQGLWQFMPGTALEYDLKINQDMDQRLDPNEATLAAIQYLKEHYEYFGDWALTLAAYNAGRGGVKRAMRRSRRNTFWGIRRYLPRETRGYVPGFIAATYLAEFFAHHELEPQLPSLDQQLTESMVIYEAASFYRIAQVTDLSIETIENLNPGYTRGFIPASDQGHYLILPKRVMTAWREYLALGKGKAEDRPLIGRRSPFLNQEVSESDDHKNYLTGVYTIQSEDDLAKTAEWLGVSHFQLRIWNKLSNQDSLYVGQEIRYFLPAAYKSYRRDTPAPIDFRLPSRELTSSFFKKNVRIPLPKGSNKIFYYLEKKKRPSEIVDKSTKVTTNDLLGWNYLGDDKPLPAGSVLVISMDLD